MSGPATTSFVVNVGGAFAGAAPVAARRISGAVPPGVYTLSVVGVNARGTSAPSSMRTVTVH